MGMFDAVAGVPHKNTDATREACARVLRGVIDAGTFRATDTFAAPNPWSTMAREVLTSRVGREEKQFGIKDRLIIRLAVEAPLRRTIGETIDSFGDVDRREPVHEMFDVGVHDVPVETALWLLHRAGVGIVEHTTPDGRGSIIEVGYAFGGRYHETMPNAAGPRAPEKGTLPQRVAAVLNGAPMAPIAPTNEADALRARIAELEEKVRAAELESHAPASAPDPKASKRAQAAAA